MKTIEWWRSAANHLWRTYFALIRDGVNEPDYDWTNLSVVKKNNYAICHHIFTHRFVTQDQNILKMYFTTRWGDDQYAVEDYSLRNNIPTNVIWIVIRRANRIVMEEYGLLEKKENDADE